MTQYLPPNLLALFAPRDPVPYLPPLDKLPHEKKNTEYTAVGSFLKYFENPKDTPPPTRVETRDERLERKRREKQEQAAYKLEQDIALWDPVSNPNCTSDPYKTLFIARINYDTSESKLRREFEVYGPIKKIHLVHDVKNGKPRGYAFIEYEHERDMHSAYKHADGKKIDGRRVLVDVERARTVKGWLPRRLGGGLGGTRRGGPDVNIKHSGREEVRGDGERERVVDRASGGDRERGGGGSGGGGSGGSERERDRRRSHSRGRDSRRRNKSRSRSREPRRRDRRNKRSRDRSRDRDKDRRDRDGLEEKVDGDLVEIPEDNNGSSKRDRKRSRSRDRDRKRRRSRSRSHDRDRKKRDRGSRRDRGEHDERPSKQSNADVSIKRGDEDDSYSNGPTASGGGTGRDDYNENSADEPYDGYSGSQYGNDYGGENDEGSNQYYDGGYNSTSYGDEASLDKERDDDD